MLDFSSFDKALRRFNEGLVQLQADSDNTLIRDGVIQRFEFTYELSHKMLKRFLEATSANSADIDRLSFQDLIRTANEQGLLKSDWTQWKVYRQMRNDTSHTYDETKALKVVEKLEEFRDEAEFLLDELNRRNTGL